MGMVALISLVHSEVAWVRCFVFVALLLFALFCSTADKTRPVGEAVNKKHRPAWVLLTPAWKPCATPRTSELSQSNLREKMA